MYQVRDLRFSYFLGSQKIDAVRGVSFDIGKGDFICLSGPSGSGKTTLLNLLGLIEPLEAPLGHGEILLDGQSLHGLAETKKNSIRRHKVGFVFQNFHLFPVLRADENVEFFLARMGVPADQRKARVQKALEAVGLWEHRQKKPLEMSGGQRQRVAIARAIAKSPEIIIADEPTASLDQKTGREIMEILVKLNQESGVTLVVASHDAMVHSYAKSRIKMLDGLLEGKLEAQS